MKSATLKEVCRTGMKASTRPNWMLANGAMAAAATIKRTATPTAIAFCCPVAGMFAIISGKSCSSF